MLLKMKNMNSLHYISSDFSLKTRKSGAALPLPRWSSRMARQRNYYSIESFMWLGD
jgi:hypothetical protein